MPTKKRKHEPQSEPPTPATADDPVCSPEKPAAGEATESESPAPEDNVRTKRLKVNNEAEAEAEAAEEEVVEKVEEEGEEEEDDEPVRSLIEPFSRETLEEVLEEAALSHPDVLRRIRGLADADEAHRKIFVHGLGWDATTETLAAAFVPYGEIEECKVVAHKHSGKSKGYGFILFKRRADARKALKEPQKVIGGRTTACQLASAGPAPPPPAFVPDSQRKIYVNNVGVDVDPGRLLQFFAKFGEVEEGPLGLDKATGKPKGFALFVYKTADGVKKALETPHKNFEGRTLTCQRAIDSLKYGSNRNSNDSHHRPYLAAGPKFPAFNQMPPPQTLNPFGQTMGTLFAGQGADHALANYHGLPQAGLANSAGFANAANGFGYPGKPPLQRSGANPQVGLPNGGSSQPGFGNFGGHNFGGIVPFMGQ